MILEKKDQGLTMGFSAIFHAHMFRFWEVFLGAASAGVEQNAEK